jgi:hypothetical protein
VAALSLAEAKDLLAVQRLTEQSAFDVLATIGRAGASPADRHEAREVLIRVLEQRASVPAALRPLLASLVRQHGLFPYLDDVETLGLAERIAYEAHRPDGQLGEELVFHAEQSQVYERLIAGDNVVLSAPTSFGKSKVVDAYLDAKGFRNAVVVVPTIALIDETRRRLSRLAGPGGYTVITHASQRQGERNLFVMTQERLLEYGDALPHIEFFVIDEFYKLDFTHAGTGSEHRCSQLNVAFDKLRRTGAQFYLLGPNITALDNINDDDIQATFINTNFTTVATDVERLAVDPADVPDALAEQCRRVGGATLIFCSSPGRIQTVADWLLSREIGLGSAYPGQSTTPQVASTASEKLAQAADWVGETYHEQWIVARALRAGIGIHHGQLPRALGHHMVRLFNEGQLPYLLVTSTLIEGVNTSARNVLILDHTIARKRYDYFTFANIRGRSGRMFQHFVGRVVVFNPEPRRVDLTVDVPAITQSRRTTPEVLIQLPEDELTLASRRRLAPYLDQELVSLDTLRANRGVPLDNQLRAAEAMQHNPSATRAALRWRGAYPTTQQVKNMGELLFELTGGPSRTVRTSKQLAARINILRHHRGHLRDIVQAEIDGPMAKTVDDAVHSTLDFVRTYAQFKIPTALGAAASLARDALGSDAASNPNAFASQLENIFQPPYATVLEEYGVPTTTSVKLQKTLRLHQAESLDDVLDHLRAVDPEDGRLHPFERDMLTDTQQTLRGHEGVTREPR